MAYTFDLVPVGGVMRLTEDAFSKVQFLLSESQPATKVQATGDPVRIRVRAQGRWAEVAPAVLDRVQELVGVSLKQMPVRRW